MNRISPFLFFLIFLSVTVQCTSTRWTVSDVHALDEREVPERISSGYTVIIRDSVSVSNPFLHLSLYRIDELEYTQRVLVERTVQQYQPKWTFALLGGLGASIAFYAGNSDGFIENRSGKQSLALNTAGAILSLMAFTNMRAAGDAIHTGETRYLRKSGSEIRSDSVRVTNIRDMNSDMDIAVKGYIHVRYGDEVLFERDFADIDIGDYRIRLTSLLNGRTIIGPNPGMINVTMGQDDQENSFSIPVSRFMKPVVMVTSPSTELRTAPVYNSQAPLAEVGNGSELALLDESQENWFEVQLGGSNLFVNRDDGEIHWIEEENVPSVVTLEEVPFGQLSVEFSVPVLNEAQPAGFGLLLNNYGRNQLGSRRYIERDIRLMNLYLRDALGVPQQQIHRGEMTGQQSFSDIMERVQRDSATAGYIYISGFARFVRDGDDKSVELVHLDENSEINFIDLEQMLLEIASQSPKKMVAFIDLDFSHSQKYGGDLTESTDNVVYRNIADSVSARNENSALIFSSRPDQVPGLFESVRHERKYHNLFPYYVAQAIQQRRVILSDIVRHVENQVDYTSRRLHDRPQNVQSYGNMTINLSR